MTQDTEGAGTGLPGPGDEADIDGSISAAWVVSPPPDAVELAIERLNPQMVMLARERRRVAVMLGVIVLLVVIGFIASIMTGQWMIATGAAVAGAGVMIWPARKLYAIFRDEIPLRVIPAIVPLVNRDARKELLDELIRSYIKSLKDCFKALS